MGDNNPGNNNWRTDCLGKDRLKVQFLHRNIQNEAFFSSLDISLIQIATVSFLRSFIVFATMVHTSTVSLITWTAALLRQKKGSAKRIED
ncbi:hypothetical protein NECAME_13883 [Necator americanus]|uniref:Uncharacterized protein n=1 Tax=Necator americanus TaxID=51031 RepID=W2SUL9_NECAM|nr:hypothetical protein NECAME_13883 [Necator americanus]ETN72392.1 hypothetical protein NECAME_13883 [Necator americanus]